MTIPISGLMSLPRGERQHRQLFVGRQLAITLMLWVVFFMSLLIIYLLSSWMPTLLNHRGIDLQHASWVTAAFQIGGTLARWLLGVLMDRYNPFRVLALSYAWARSVSS
jgi:AAHS family 4-hydroxybenzoate transporter-like MFS transporter